MQFEPNNIYHIFNRGNNSQTLYFNRKNYLFFLKKVKTYIIPFSDIIAWCLMPNHFHLMVYLNQVEVKLDTSEGFTSSETLTKSRKRTFNNSIGILLRSYSRAIQKQEKLTGSLFQKNTKSICLTDNIEFTPAWFQTNYGTIINIIDPEKEYPQVCFNYIHENPVKAGIVNKAEDWEFSSFKDYAGLRKGKLVNRNRAEEFGLDIIP